MSTMSFLMVLRKITKFSINVTHINTRQIFLSNHCYRDKVKKQNTHKNVAMISRDTTSPELIPLVDILDSRMAIMAEKFSEEFNTNLSLKSITNLKLIEDDKKSHEKHLDDIATFQCHCDHIAIFPQNSSKETFKQIIASLGKHYINLFPEVIDKEYVKVPYPLQTDELRQKVYSHAKQYSVYMKKIMFNDMNKLQKKFGDDDSSKELYNKAVAILKTYNEKANQMLEDKKSDLKL